jgi:3-oxoacyl-[acyl-carrier protein] reductase
VAEPRVALVTGCGKRDGMGRAIAKDLAASGAVVCVSDRVPTGVLNLRQEVLGVGDAASWGGVDSLVEEIRQAGGEASATLGDIGSEDDAGRMVQEVVDRHGRLEILVNTAAAPQGRDRADVEEVPLEVFDEVVRINLRGTFLMSRFAVPHMRRRRWGRIVNISSLAGLTGAPFSTAYSASKAGVIGLTRALAADVASWGITVNAICPGMVATSRAVISQDPDLDVKEEIARRGRSIAVGRPGTPEDVAAAVAYFASEGASYVTGQALVLDGGGFSGFRGRRPPESNGGASA